MEKIAVSFGGARKSTLLKYIKSINPLRGKGLAKTISIPTSKSLKKATEAAGKLKVRMK